ncbi:MAG TPA: sigma-54 dependent transcriptional regulator [Terracidiphilus sp.]|nr:sigma-54 dependent transcriptional regulator [Terracidiphilus sp.]
MNGSILRDSSVLVVDDEPGMRTALEVNFAREGWRVESAGGVHEAARAMERASFDLVVTDVRMRDGTGFDVLNSAQKRAPSARVILLTAYGSVPEAVESMRGGAVDYLMKPVSFEQLQSAAARVMRGATESTRRGEHTVAGISGVRIIGRSPLLLKALERARAAAATDADVLIEAESGTGKELLARYIHAASSRNRRPFLAVNCAALPEALLESELFGFAKGAFTGAAAAKAGKFELANGGTILLDEIGEMPLNLQPKLLRVLQERELERLGESRMVRLDLRVIATTNASLSAMVERGTFRSDLYYRLDVIPLSIPPLRDRGEDVEVLANHFAEKFAAEQGRPLVELAPDFVAALRGHAWPGNVRELANFMRRVLSLHAGGAIDAARFQEEMTQVRRPEPAVRTLPAAPGTPISVLEKIHLENTLALTRGNRTHAAEMLGISLRTMRNKIREYGLPPRRYA